MNPTSFRPMNSYTLIVGKDLSNLHDSKYWREFILKYFNVDYVRCFAINYRNHPNHQIMVNGQLSSLVIHDLFSGRYPSTINEFLDEFFMRTHMDRIGRRRIFVHTTDAICFNRLIEFMETYQFINGELLPGSDLIVQDFKI